MKTLRTVSEMKAFSEQAKKKTMRIGFVPTMGALHEGHLVLIRKARGLADQIVVSIFVNPTQFDRPDDLEKYPRPEAEDLKKCAAEGVEIAFVPTVQEIYPEGPKTTVQVPPFTKVLCGASRPGHFEGVATVVLRLFEIVQPDLAIFGEKDYQQLLLIRWLVKEHSLPIEIVSHATVREPDGLAISSRNRRLNPEQRTQALTLYRSIRAVQRSFAAGERTVSRLLTTVRSTFEQMPEVKLDYAELRDAETLAHIETIERPALYAIAALVGPVRLIDNCVLRSGPPFPIASP